jgi:mannan endo-1,4-beta-mannosidase
MMLKTIVIFCFLSISLITGSVKGSSDVVAVDFVKKRSILTQKLYDRLLAIKGKGFYFGMHDATGYGVGWRNNNDSSDIKSVCGDYPAFAGWGADYSPCRLAQGEGFEDARYKIKLFHRLGGFNTVEWHAQNPYGGNFYWETHPDKSKNVVASILPGGENHSKFTEQLDNLANFFNSLVDENGEKIPVIFRPWHEHTGDWFWWGAGHCSVEEYKALWRFTVEYLSVQKNVDNLLYAYSPDRFNNKEDYLLCYPGDEYIDIIGLDNYWNLRENASDLTAFREQLRIITSIANEKGKPAALTETGPLSIDGKAVMGETDWYTNKLLKSILFDEQTRQISYVMVWRNDNPEHFHVPYPGHPSVPDFIEFYNSPFTIFMSDINEK